jgi:hypothetical protein
MRYFRTYWSLSERNGSPLRTVAGETQNREKEPDPPSGSFSFFVCQDPDEDLQTKIFCRDLA